METEIIITTSKQLRTILEEVISASLKTREPFIAAVQANATIAANPFGDFNWLQSICPIPESTLRQKSAKGEIPGIIKFGKRVLYNKATVLKWLEALELTMKDADTSQQIDNSQFEQRHVRLTSNQRKGGRTNNE